MRGCPGHLFTPRTKHTAAHALTWDNDDDEAARSLKACVDGKCVRQARKKPREALRWSLR